MRKGTSDSRIKQVRRTNRSCLSHAAEMSCPERVMISASADTLSSPTHSWIVVLYILIVSNLLPVFDHLLLNLFFSFGRGAVPFKYREPLP